LHNNKLIN